MDFPVAGENDGKNRGLKSLLVFQDLASTRCLFQRIAAIRCETSVLRGRPNSESEGGGDSAGSEFHESVMGDCETASKQSAVYSRSDRILFRGSRQEGGA